MLVVYRAADLTDAALFRERLAQLGIRSGLRNDMLQGALGELPLTLRPEVFVFDEADVGPARRCVAEFEASRSVDEVAGEVRCPQCGEDNPSNFELCWKCRAELPPSSEPNEL